MQGEVRVRFSVKDWWSLLENKQWYLEWETKTKGAYILWLQCCLVFFQTSLPFQTAFSRLCCKSTVCYFLIYLFIFIFLCCNKFKAISTSFTYFTIKISTSFPNNMPLHSRGIQRHMHCCFDLSYIYRNLNYILHWAENRYGQYLFIHTHMKINT